jgi:putative FmdB family regulatory protein
MPLNDFRCEGCGYTFEKYTPTYPKDNRLPCPECGKDAVKVFSNFMMMIGKRTPFLYQTKFRD